MEFPIIKEIKWSVEKRMATNDTVLNANIVVTALDEFTLREVGNAVIEKVRDQFLSENEEKIKRDIIDNPKFADALYNAIVLKKSNEKLL